MGNCETCDNVDRRGNLNVLLLPDKENPNNQGPLTPEELPQLCNEAVREAYAKLGPYEFRQALPYEWRDPVELDNGLVVYKGQWH